MNWNLCIQKQDSNIKKAIIKTSDFKLLKYKNSYLSWQTVYHKLFYFKIYFNLKFLNNVVTIFISYIKSMHLNKKDTNI